MGVAPYKRLIHDDWLALTRIVNDLYRILNVDTTLSDILTPPGSDGEVIYNKNDVYGADSTFNFNDVTKVLTAKVLKITTVASSSSDTDKFLVDDSDEIKFRTGAQLLSDIGGSASGHLHDTQTLQHDGVNSDGGAFSFATTGDVTFNQNILTAGATITNCAVLGSDSAIFQPNADAVDFFQIKNAAGTAFIIGDSTNGRLGINGEPAYPLDIWHGGIAFIMGGDNDAVTRTDETIKYGRMGIPHYTNAEEPVAIFLAQSESADSWLNIGGGSTYFNAVTDIIFFTAANNTTTRGTELMRLNSVGLGIGTTLDSLFPLTVTGEGAYGRIASFVGDGTEGTYSRITIGGVSGDDTQISFLDGTATKWSIGNDATDDSFQIHTGFGVFDGTSQFSLTTAGLAEFQGTTPYITLHNSTHEDSDGGRESKLIFKGEKLDETEHTLAIIEAGHDGTGNDQKGYIDLFINDGDDDDSPTHAVTIKPTRFGIGTESPNAPLEVKGSLPGDVGGSPSGLLHVTNASDSEFANSVITGHNSFNGSGNTQLWYLGSTTGSDNNIAFINRQNADLSLWTNDTARLRITNDGNTKIGDAGITNYVGIDATGVLGLNGLAGLQLPHMMQSDSTNQTVGTANVAQVVTFNTDVHHFGITRTTLSRFTILKEASYLIAISALCDTTVANKDIEVWLRINGNDIANSNTIVHLGTAAETTLAVTYIKHFDVNDYFEFWMTGENTGCRLLATAAVTTEGFERPACPSIIMTCNYIGVD